MKVTAEGFASHAAVLSFVADDGGCRSKLGGNGRAHVSSGSPTMNAVACAATSKRRTHA